MQIRPTLRAVLAVVLAVSLTATAHARSCHGVAIAETVLVDGKTLALNGVGLREATVFNVDVLVAALYVEHPSTKAAVLLSSDQRVQMVLHFVRDTSAAELRSDLGESLDDNAPSASSAHKNQLLAWLTAMSVGDTMTFTYVPGLGLTVGVRGRTKGTIASRDFARAVLSTMIGAHPKSESLRAALLGGGCE